MSEQTTQEAYLAEMLGDVYKIRKESEASLQDIKKMRDSITESFVGVEKSICEMNTLVEDSVKKAGDKSSATLATKMDLMINQITAYLTEEAKKLRQVNIDLTKKEIEEARLNATKEIANLIHRINGNKLETKLIAYTLIFALASSLITCSITYVIIKNNYSFANYQQVENSATTTKQKR